MAVTEAPWRSTQDGPISCELECLSPRALNLLCEGDLETARKQIDNSVPPFLLSDSNRRTWRRRRDQHITNPDDRIWTTRIIRDQQTRAIVGRAGFHARPDQRGMVEFGYAVDPELRCRGYGTSGLRTLLEVCRDDPRVNVIRASISPSNWISRRIVTRYGFQKVGEEMDEEDGLEEVFELVL